MLAGITLPPLSQGLEAKEEFSEHYFMGSENYMKFPLVPINNVLLPEDMANHPGWPLPQGCSQVPRLIPSFLPGSAQL